jgi:tetratricopeptide (TPR) repeat protein
VLVLGVAMTGASAGQQPAEPIQPIEAYTLSGRPLFRPTFPAETAARLEKNLADAQAAYDRNPRDEERAIWLGRRLAYLGRYRDAIDVYTRGLAQHPSSFKLHRHRGHRYITIRQFDKAIADLEKAASLIEGVPDEVEPDGAPNRFNKPRSTSHSNIWYHLGLAYYLKGDFDNALRSYRECMTFSTVNDDMLVATADWLYMTLRRLSRDDEAKAVLEPITEKMDILENESYHRRLLMYKGLVAPESLLSTDGVDDLSIATEGYGVANWHSYNGRVDEAKALLEKVAASPSWAAFGTIAAEADLHRVGAKME